MIRHAALPATLALALWTSSAASAPQRDTLIRPAKGIGKVNLGMNLTEVKRALGPPQLVNRRVPLGFGRTYVEYAWDYSFWRVGFLVRSGRFRTVLVGTVSRGQRTRSGVGPGSRLPALRRALPGRCTLNGRYREPGARWPRHWLCMLGRSTERHTVFLLDCIEHFGPTCSAIEAEEVVVREPV